ncbi:MAG: aquaporin [Actinomycetes bacterium]
MSFFNRKFLAEFLGTTVFLTAIVGANAAGSPLRQVSLALALGLMILLFGPISGGHFNPAVSVYFYSTKALNLKALVSYILAQLLGGLAGAWLGITIWGGGLHYGGPSSANLAPLVGGEVLATAGLVTLIAQLVITKRDQLIWIVVPLWVFAAGTFTQTGAQANPAVSLALISAGHNFTDQALTAITEFLGMLLAVALLLVINRKEPKPTRKK